MSRSYRSIGDVLTLLRGEFPDITISKIRFLESQGLVSPQRSPSGYRKFYDEDVERLRYVLVQQREHFLPLKVIRDRLNGIETEEGAGLGDPPPSITPSSSLKTAAMASERVDGSRDVTAGTTEEPVEVTSVEVMERVEVTEVVTQRVAARTVGDGRTSEEREPTVADVLAALQEAPARREASAQAPAAKSSPRREAKVDVTNSMTAEELAAETGLDVAEIEALVSYGILRSTDVAGLTCFDDRAVEVARLATGFLSLGVEARHLKLFRNGVDRELGLIEQLVTPLLRQRNPEARARAEATTEELAALGRDLHAAMLAREIDGLLGR